MNDEELKTSVRRGYRATAREAQPPDFDQVWAAAEAQTQRRTPWRAVAAGVAVFAAIGFFALSWQGPGEPMQAWTAEISDSLMNTAMWSAPSDVLLQQDGIDVYSTVPPLIESTELEVETLL